MPAFGDPSLHFWLTRGVARSVGVSFREAMLERRLQQQDYAGIVNDCRCCGHVERCQAWLAGNPDGGDVPEFCLIRERLEHLKPH